ncbi:MULTISPECIES: ACP S-malonyltransferase [unclassified Streptomyces]|uniref:ACP S-malonyltransferase n=1 Tax=unclassified Streptomyces TaxID=2593676 RepID=UPI003817445D
MLSNPHARELAAVADDVLGHSVADRFSASEDPYCVDAQVAFMVNCVALARWSQHELGTDPAYCAGPSFGGKSAAAWTGSLSFPDAVLMTAELARITEEYFRTDHQDVVTHSFIRTPADRLDEILAEMDAAGEWYEISCYLDDDFFMVTLRERALDDLQRRLRAVGGLPLYTMRPPMHSSVFGPLRERARLFLDSLPFTDPAVPIVADHDGRLVDRADDVRTLLLDCFVRPLRWPLVIGTLRELAVGDVVVAGPDNLFGRVAATRRAFEVTSVSPQFALLPAARRAAARMAPDGESRPQPTPEGTR